VKPKQYLLKGNEVKHATKEVGAINLSKINDQPQRKWRYDMAYAIDNDYIIYAYAHTTTLHFRLQLTSSWRNAV